MKKLVLPFILCTFFVCQPFASAQKKYTRAHEKKQIGLDAGIGIGGNLVGLKFFRSNLSPALPVFIKAYYGVHDYASVGGQLASGIYFSNPIAPLINLSANADFHWWNLLDDQIDKDIKSDIVDLYTGLDLGINLVIFDHSSTRPINALGFLVSWSLGIHYFPKKNIGLMTEVGLGTFSNMRIGVASRF